MEKSKNTEKSATDAYTVLSAAAVNVEEYVYEKVKKSEKVKSLKYFFCVETTLSSKDDLIWQLKPIRKVEHARTLIFFLL